MMMIYITLEFFYVYIPSGVTMFWQKLYRNFMYRIKLAMTLHCTNMGMK
jgi:hypothetical protein